MCLFLVYVSAKNKIHVQTNTESVQCLSKKQAYHNKVHVTRELKLNEAILAKKPNLEPNTKLIG